MAIVTKQNMVEVITTKERVYVEQYVGRALVAIFNRQLKDEQNANTTSHSNGVGFASCDARIGSITAKYFLKHKKLQDWQLEKWVSNHRIAKYHRQLNEIAETKKAG